MNEDKEEEDIIMEENLNNLDMIKINIEEEEKKLISKN
jgi:hypothetical protein